VLSQDYIENNVITQIQDAIRNRDVLLIDPRSRQAQVLTAERAHRYVVTIRRHRMPPATGTLAAGGLRPSIRVALFRLDPVNSGRAQYVESTARRRFSGLLATTPVVPASTVRKCWDPQQRYVYAI